MFLSCSFDHLCIHENGHTNGSNLKFNIRHKEVNEILSYGPTDKMISGENETFQLKRKYLIDEAFSIVVTGATHTASFLEP